MNRFNRAQQQLLAVAMMATINHKMVSEAKRFLPILPRLIPNQKDGSFVCALMLLTLNRRQEALACLNMLDSEAVQALRELIEE